MAEAAGAGVAYDDVEYLDDLLLYIRAGRVIPIIGPELVTVAPDGVPIPLEQYLAGRLADRLRVNRADLGPEPTLSHVVARYTAGRGRPGDVPPRLFTILTEREFEAPEVLRKLARIRPFRLFVSTTFDSLLVRAIDEVRFGGAARTRQLAYAPNRMQDLAPGWTVDPAPTVFHLFGRASAERSFVITDEDLLEFLHALQSDARRPTVLFDELDQHHLLFIGCRFPDWLARFVLRTTRRGALSPQRDQMEVVADAGSSRDANLSLFLDQFSFNTKVFPGDAAAFVDALVTRWQTRYPDEVLPDGVDDERSSAFGSAAPLGDTTSGGVAIAAPTTGLAPVGLAAGGLASAPVAGAPPTSPVEGAAATVMRPGSVFISYASEDRAAAFALCERLSTVDVWLDRQELRPGADWDMQIRHNIRQCALFLPVLSRNAAARTEGYFRREWTEALRRAEGIDQMLQTFLVPVAVDDVPNNAPGIPGEFWSRHVERFAGGDAAPEFCAYVTDLVRRYRRGVAG